MGKLTSEEQRQLNNARTRAVNQAKRDEVKLIREGKGTRDWTSAQQKEWLQTGKCHGIKGHHMKNVSDYPRYAGDKNNIQLLNSKEHLAAHSGDFKNKTNGYYNPDTGRISSFGSNPPSRPEAAKLSNPLSERSVKYNTTMRKNADAQKAAAKKMKSDGALQKTSKAKTPEKKTVPEKTDSKTLAKSRNLSSGAKAPEKKSGPQKTDSKTLTKSRSVSGSSPKKSGGVTHSHAKKATHSH